MYDLPEFDHKTFKQTVVSILENKLVRAVFLVAVIGVSLAIITGRISLENLQGQFSNLSDQVQQTLTTPLLEPAKAPEKYISKIEYEQAIIDSVKSASTSVVSIVISKNVTIYEQEFVNPFGESSPFGTFLLPQNVPKGTKLEEVGAGSGFIVSEDGLVLTNKHVVKDKAAKYTVIVNDGKKYEAKVLALDPVQDLAIIKISDPSTGSGQAAKFPSIKLGNSDGIQIGQGAIAIGNALGQFSNTVSVGVISGLGRTVNASDQTGSFSETLEGTIQTDAAINQGNSGGPLLNLRGEVIGVNVATATGAQSIGFAIPINLAARDINQIIKTNKITYPFLGVRYLLVDESVKEKYKLSVDYGALVMKGDNGEVAVTKDSAAAKAGIKEKDVVLEINGEKITIKTSLAKLIQKYNPGDTVTLKVLREGKEMTVEAVLTERPQ